MPDEIATDTRLRQLRKYTSVLDDGIRIPGTRIRFGLDPLLGLVPGAGDVAGAALSAAIVMEAVRQRVPATTLLRMVSNIAVDTGLGVVPIAGDLFDAAWKSNRRNLELLERHLGRPSAIQSSRILSVTLLVVAVVLLLLGIVAGIATIVWLLAKVT